MSDDWDYRRLLEWNSAPNDSLEIVFTPHSTDPAVWLEPSIMVGANLMGPPVKEVLPDLDKDWEIFLALPYRRGPVLTTRLNTQGIGPGLDIRMAVGNIQAVLWDHVGPRVTEEVPCRDYNLIFLHGSRKELVLLCNDEIDIQNIVGMQSRQGGAIQMPPRYHALLYWQRILTDRERELLTRHYEETWAPLQTL